MKTLASHFQSGHDSSAGIFDMISRWIAHAAVWRIMDHLPLVLVIALGAAAVGFMLYRTRRRKQARGD